MISVVIPVLDGARYLDEVLSAVTAQVIDEPFEVLVIDSGSTDGSLEIVAAHPGVRLIEIPAEEFGHGRTRNLGVQQTSGELIAFLTQDATPANEHWLMAYRDAFALEPRVGAAYGPHLPRDGVDPLMARILVDHFAGFGGADGRPVIQRLGDTPYLSNSNSCIARAAWEVTPFRDIAYSEDQAFGADVLANGFAKAYVPAAGALHSHDYTMIEAFKRFFDDYRGLNESTGERTEASPGRALDVVRTAVADDLDFLERLGQPGWRRAAWGARSAVYHAGRVGFAGLGARADRLPGAVRRAISLDGRGDGVGLQSPVVEESEFALVGEVEREGVVPLVTGDGVDRPLHVAWVIPPFGVGGGGHTTIFRMVRALERRGHHCSLWIHDPVGADRASSAAMRKRLRDHYFELDAPLHTNWGQWDGADVAVATSWDTVYRVLRLSGCVQRAYFAQDHEPEFHPTSARSLFAERSYRYGLFCICFSEWLARLVRQRYGAEAVHFDLGVEPGEYSPLGMPRRSDTIAFYGRQHTGRRAVDLGVLALAEVKRRRPRTKIAIYGSNRPLPTPFDYQHLGIVSRERLCRLYNESTVGLAMSLTTYSLIPQEMMACGLPVVELAGRSCELHYGADGQVIALAEPDSADIADRLIELLDNPELRAQRSGAALEFVGRQTWDAAADIVIGALLDIHARATSGSGGWAAGSLI